MNRSLTERARCLRLNAGFPKSFWAEAMSMACYLINRSPRASLGGNVAEEAYNLGRDRQRRTNVKPPSRLGYEDMVSFALLISGDEPTTFHVAITSQEKKEWMGAMAEEMEYLQKNQTSELVQLPQGKKTIGYKWVYRKKPSVSEKQGKKFKARLMDVKTAFLHGDLEEQIYMEQPDRFTQPGHEHLICKLKKSLYGLKQSPRQWYKRFDSYMLQIGYKWCEYDCCVYVKGLHDGSSIFLLLYVNNMLIVAKNMYDVLALKALLSQEFDVKDLGAATKILGTEIHRDRGSRKLWLSQ
ncbi:UNVERIFIED_CONTAM: Retrovirus-related Pol polyprotein from transposon TNT 1-94 [Sesamum radiatum]|uniref:Retrovirus-related Pol polyprotein from transposon TNT 1-94 n=1 Tax=Sesamum radiatum TaxID=300843 RepID=A0AAW2P3Y9_SESRA